MTLKDMPRGIDRVKHLPVLRLTSREFEALLDYSASLPTGTTPGKRWRRLDGCHDERCPIHARAWMIGEYELLPKDHPKRDTEIKVNWYRPVIVVPAMQVRRDAKGNTIPWAKQHDYFMGFDPDNPDVPTD